jgi:hypothetical protein
MRAELRWLETNDFRTWEEFSAAERPDPFDCSGWFACGIGSDAEPGEETFQFVVATPGAVSRVQRERRGLRLLVVGEFTRAAIEDMLREHVSKITGYQWSDISNQLRKTMYSEYESTRQMP